MFFDSGCKQCRTILIIHGSSVISSSVDFPVVYIFCDISSWSFNICVVSKKLFDTIQFSAASSSDEWGATKKSCTDVLPDFYGFKLFAVAIWPVTGQGVKNTKWPAVFWKLWPAVELKKVLSVTKHGFVFWARRKPNARLEIYIAFQDRLTCLNRHMIV